MGYHLNRLDEPVFIAASKPLLTEIGIHHSLESCEIYLECVPLMFVGGADTELVNNIGRRPIHIASDSESLQLLLDHGARVDAQVRRADCYSFNFMLILRYSRASMNLNFSGSCWKRCHPLCRSVQGPRPCGRFAESGM